MGTWEEAKSLRAGSISGAVIAAAVLVLLAAALFAAYAATPSGADEIPIRWRQELAI